MLDSELVPAAGARPWLIGQKLEFSQEWRHEGFTLGELVSSMSLLPDEELTIEVSSYQRTRQEIQTEQDDTKRTALLNEQRDTDESSRHRDRAGAGTGGRLDTGCLLLARVRSGRGALDKQIRQRDRPPGRRDPARSSAAATRCGAGTCRTHGSSGCPAPAVSGPC